MVSSYKTFPFINPVVLIFGFICLIYAQTLDSPWHMDDYHNIKDNLKIQMNTLDLSSIKASLYATPDFENTLYRPVSNLSFALNWFWGKDDVKGYHVVNIAIHMVTAFLLYLTLIQLLQTPNAGKWDQDSLYFIALLSSIFWAIHPIQIQAVTYIVQRMAALAALFYIMGILCFLKARMTCSPAQRTIFTVLCTMSFALGLGSKNNAILLPVFLLLIEFVFFRDLSSKSFQKKAVVVIITAALLIAVAGVLLFFEKGLSQILDPYKVKPFSMGQRLLTQPTVLLFYLSQIFYPIAHRFSIAHDVTYATSLFQPWYTFFSISIVIFLIGLALFRICKTPILSFAILFYFGNHVVESTFLPLEMIFEHRNYLPSFFLFVPVSMGLKNMLNHYRVIKKSMYYLLLCFTCAILIGIGFSTYIRNWDWRSTQSLWQDAADKAPKLARPLHNLAWGHYEPAGQIEKALELFQKALNLKDDQAYNKAVLHGNLARIYYSKLKDYDKAVGHARKSVEIQPNFLPAQMILNFSLAKLGQYEDALSNLYHLLETHQSEPEIHSLIAAILVKISKYDLAILHFQQCLRLDTGNLFYIRDFGICLTQMGYFERGYWFLNQARVLDSKDIGVLMALADNRLKKGTPEEAFAYIQLLIQIVGFEHIETILEDISKDSMGAPFDLVGLSMIIAGQLRDLSDSHRKTADHLIQTFEARQ